MTAPRVGAGIVAFAAAITTALLTAWLPSTGWLRATLVAMGTAMSIVLSRWVFTHSRDPSSAILRSMGAGAIHAIFCGGVLAPLFFFLGDKVSTGAAEALGIFIGFAISATVVGVPFGGMVGLAYSVMPAVAAKTRTRPSHGDVDRVVTVGAVWLLLVGAVHSVIIAVATENNVGENAMGENAMDVTSHILLATLWIAPLVVAACLLGIVAIRAMQRARFLAAARVGEDARFRIVPRKERHLEPIGILPLHHGVQSETCESVLVRIGDPQREVLYRDAAERDVEERVVALLP
jgi:hypothetical protein